MQIRDVVRAYLLENHAHAGEGLEFTDTTPLLTYGILDSIAVMQLVTYLEFTFSIEFEPRDLDRRRLDTIEEIEQLVRRKIAEARSGPAGPPPEPAGDLGGGSRPGSRE